MLTESELKWLRERPAIKHTCEDCWKTEARKSSNFVYYDRLNAERNGEPWLLSECEWCKWRPDACPDDADNWESKDWFRWLDGDRIDYGITKNGIEQSERHHYWQCFTVEDWKDAAEFEAQVAAKLSDLDFATGGEPCEQCPFCNEEYCTDVYKVKNQRECTSKWSRVKEARLSVEEEMDG